MVVVLFFLFLFKQNRKGTKTKQKAMKQLIAFLFIISMIIIGTVLVNHNLSLPTKQRSSVLTKEKKRLDVIIVKDSVFTIVRK